MQLCFDIEDAAVKDLRVFSDAMDGELIQAAERCLDGQAFDWDALAEALEHEFPQQAEMGDLAAWFRERPALQA